MTTLSVASDHQGPLLGALTRRLRAWSLSSWQHADRIGQTRTALQELADLAGGAQGRPAPRVPELSALALADQLMVLGREANAAGRAEDAAMVLERLTGALGLR